ncbi:MAG: pentapeptide repeat-containing protein [Pseudanabaena sp.]|jgi:uncharacterized protein YjbI with pentapeptide repeats
MKYWQLIASFFLSTIIFFVPLSITSLSAQAASSSSVTRSLLNEADGESFAGKNLIRAEFNSTTFRNTDFSNADLRGALFNGVLLDGANLHGVDLGSAIIYVSRFKNVDLTDAVLTDANMLRSSFDNVNVTDADFSNALLDLQQVKKICRTASGTNSKTGVDTRESLGCD